MCFAEFFSLFEALANGFLSVPDLVVLVPNIQQGNKISFEWLEKRLKPLGFCIILCTRGEDSFPNARTKRLEISGNPQQYVDLDVFIHQQELFRTHVSNSILPYTEIDVSNGDLNQVCTKIADFLENNDLLGLYD